MPWCAKKNGRGGADQAGDREQVIQDYELLQYYACTLLGYSLSEWRVLRTAEIYRQIEMYKKMHRQDCGDEKEEIVF